MRGLDGPDPFGGRPPVFLETPVTRRFVKSALEVVIGHSGELRHAMRRTSALRWPVSGPPEDPINLRLRSSVPHGIGGIICALSLETTAEVRGQNRPTRQFSLA